MKTLMLVSLLASLAAAPAAQVPGSSERARVMTADELRHMLEGKGKILFLDVREPKELQDLGTIKGYVNIPVDQLEKRLAEIPRDRAIITACDHGKRAARAADILLRNGYKALGACRLADWRERGFPLVYPKPEQKH